MGRTNGGVWVGNVPLNGSLGIPKCIGGTLIICKRYYGFYYYWLQLYKVCLIFNCEFKLVVVSNHEGVLFLSPSDER